MTKTTGAPRPSYTLEFKEEAARLVAGGQGVAETAKNLGVTEQALLN